MCHTPLKSFKYETIQKLSKLFNKTPVLNSITKHTISTTPDTRLVVHNQESNLSHGSFEDLSTILRQDRRQMTRKDILTRQGRESLQMTHNHFCEVLGNPPDPKWLFVIRVKRELKRVYRNGCRYNERLNAETGGPKTPHTHWVVWVNI